MQALTQQNALIHYLRTALGKHKAQAAACLASAQALRQENSVLRSQVRRLTAPKPQQNETNE